jgi:hypothetical protein
MNEETISLAKSARFDQSKGTFVKDMTKIPNMDQYRNYKSKEYMDKQKSHHTSQVVAGV